VPAPRPRGISDIMPKIQNVSLSSRFLVKFALPRSPVRTFMRQKGINDRFIADDIGLLCSDAVLPGSALASLNTAGDFQGVIERFAHTRNFTQINLEFYIDNEYKSLKFLEHWMEYIAGASSADPVNDSYHFKMRYPEEYKSNDTRIVKFEANHFQFLEYRFIGLFPLSLNSTRVSYQTSTVLKASCQFSYDRYVCGESSSLARALGLTGNKRRAGATEDGIERNTKNALNDVMSGLPLLNRDVGYTLTPDGSKAATGTLNTRVNFIRDNQAAFGIN
tara:strand:+ start:334 stop:1164 length:831 start_codon:yes stop_codon:yes gene_type:complete